MLTLTIDTGNAAFEAENGPDDPMTADVRNAECARLLRVVAGELEAGHFRGQCYDYNGNRVGTWKIA